MILLRKVPKKNPAKPLEAPKFYAAAVHKNRLELDELATAVSDRCSLRRADVHGVLVALMDIIPAELGKGNIIALGELGSFCATARSNGADTEEALNISSVKGIKLLYRPTKGLKKKLQRIDVSFAV